jgi:hypothetical protein
MNKPKSIWIQYGLVVVAATIVFIIAHWDALNNPYVINDDVRQQTFWMQQWTDPELYGNDLLTDYAKSYVPWGVKVVNYLPAKVANPVQFSKILSGILFVVSAAFLFGLAAGFKDELTAYLAVCFFGLMGGFMNKISGGISQSFVYPLLIAYLFFISRKNLRGASVTLMLQSLFNPYCFVLCLTTHVFFLIHNYWSEIAQLGRDTLGWIAGPIKSGLQKAAVRRHGPPAQGKPLQCAGKCGAEAKEPPGFTSKQFLLVNLPIILGVVLLLMKYALLVNPSLGSLVTKAQMVGMPEFSAEGRYEVYPVPSLLWQLLWEPWLFNAPFADSGALAGWLYMIPLIALVGHAVLNWRNVASTEGFRVFLYLAPASAILYVLAGIFLMKLFVPSRYFEYSVNLFYCLGLAVCARVAMENLDLKKCATPILICLLLLGGIRLHNSGVYDYSEYANLYTFINKNTPKDALIAGQPDLMDDVITFGKRKVFVSYELSHAWVEPYWSKIKKRTFDFFKAYYSTNPEDIREFCRLNNIAYLVVNEKDFDPKSFSKTMYFQPFDKYIKEMANADTKFAILEKAEFPPVFDCGRIRVIKVGQ